MHGIFADQANITDSPDLGPPPVAHFEDGDPIKFDSKQEDSTARDPDEMPDDGRATLAANLETRKKRRESSQHTGAADWQSNSRPSQEAMGKDPVVAASQPLKSGAKRKLNVREDEDQPYKSDGQEKDAFQFARKTSDLRSSEISSNKSKQNKTSKLVGDKGPQTAAAISHARKDKSIDLTVTSISTNRKVLGPSELFPLVAMHPEHV